MGKAPVFWFTGLSGAGKTTIAQGVKARLAAQGRRVLILDGDDVRKRLHVDLGFAPGDIRRNNALIAQLCQEQRAAHDVIFVPIISPYLESRASARRLLSPGFYELYFCADLDTVVRRDTKGFYAKAERGEMDNMIGFSPGAVYESPERPDLTIDSGKESIEASTENFFGFVDKALKAGHHA